MKYKKLELLEFNQNTIDDFYPDTKAMIDDLFNLSYTKLSDFLKEGELFTKTRVLEIYGSVVRYIKTFTEGYDFQGEQ